MHWIPENYYTHCCCYTVLSWKFVFNAIFKVIMLFLTFQTRKNWFLVKALLQFNQRVFIEWKWIFLFCCSLYWYQFQLPCRLTNERLLLHYFFLEMKWKYFTRRGKENKHEDKIPFFSLCSSFLSLIWCEWFIITISRHVTLKNAELNPIVKSIWC